MSRLKNNRLLKAIWREPLDATPIWIMRQAGRYLPEYRAIRARAGSFMNLCKTPELACEVTLQPVRRYTLDAAIIFSDILTIPDAMGLELEIVENKGPVFTRSISREGDIKRLGTLDLERLAYVYEAIRLVCHEEGGIPLIGFCGSPWTLAAYMVEGRVEHGFPKIMEMCEKEPNMLHHLLNVLSKSISSHLNAQIQAGVQVVMIFDTWGGLLNTKDYEQFSLYYIKQIIMNLKAQYYNNGKGVPIILFTKGGHGWLKQMAETGCDVLGLDWEISLRAAREQIGDGVALQGNMHPNYLFQSPELIRSEVATILASYGHGSGHIFNLGHGITPDVPLEHVQVLVDAVH
ncbi:MAG TPA: uroporphyrinogen decarboxylase, partial [Gammaproteobacteria bacterium]|nr:uroporphyrinogen decarboxylase [Gammaproteobacteria bacterium]